MSSSSGSGGIGLPGILFLIFLVLKLTKVIGWSWWWVTCPLWAGLAIFGIMALLALVVGGGALGLTALFGKK